jgi:hypothetical protein
MITRKEFIIYFRENILPEIKKQYETDGKPDYPARAETWNNLTDAMVRDRELPKCALNWDNPFDKRK